MDLLQQNIKPKSKEYLVLICLWSLATIINLYKPFHIDDTFHLEAAKWIEQNPLKPMSGLITWDESTFYLHQYNQPPLYFYLIAIVGHFTGYGEFPLHLFQSVFTALAIFFFFRLAKLNSPGKALLLTAFLTLSPAFIVNQNLMVDVPLLSLHLVFFYLIISPSIKSDFTRYIAAASVLSIALLIKYTSLPLLTLLIIIPLLRRQPWHILSALIPIGILTGWSIFNYAEYGGIHIFGRSVHEHSLRSIVRQPMVFFWCLGSISTFTLALLAGKSFENRYLSNTLKLVVFTFPVIVLIAAFILKNELLSNWLLWLLFGMNGLFVLWIASSTSLKHVALYMKKRKSPDKLILVLWLASLAFFIVYFAPFMATRHLLLCLPPLLLLCADRFNKITFSGFIMIAFIGMALGVSDSIYAGVYKQQAFQIKQALPTDYAIWTTGNWGWQWYSKQAGMEQYSTVRDSDVKDGDYFVVPSNISSQELSNSFKLTEVKRDVVPGSCATYFYTANYASMYITNFKKLSWTLSAAPIDTFVVYRVYRP